MIVSEEGHEGAYSKQNIIQEVKSRLLRLDCIIDLKAGVCHLEHEDLSNDNLRKRQSSSLVLDQEVLFYLRVLELEGEPMLMEFLGLIAGEHPLEHALESSLFKVEESLIDLTAAAIAAARDLFEFFIYLNSHLL